MSKKKSRLFVAIELEKKLRDDLLMLASSFRDFSLRWTKGGNIHLTLKFIGDFPDDELSLLKEKIAELTVETPPFTLHFRGVGVFSPRRPQVLWVGVEREEHLWNLAQKLDLSLASLGIEPEKKSYRPHLTLARMPRKKNWGDPQKLLAKIAQSDFQAREKVEKITLVKSVLQPTGSVYEILQTFALCESP